ncbi:hypothetical protein [Anatilimnocola floriformis]|uniref:hypothetical protein n=1 Tax=Anatilimnocola floriformis TaxID=2948575 RepID=UPI0020C4F075|nr:hypothetical protein [Anatilimnocola floriformis]
MLFRHGDVLIQKVKDLPEEKERLKHRTLAHGELTGHSHQIREKHATMWQSGELLFLEVEGQPATVVHQEHGPIELPPGYYRVWRQREYTPERIVVVRD